MKRPVSIVLFLCSAALACNRENTEPADWRGTDPVQLLRALQTANGADRARIEERLGLNQDVPVWSADNIANALDRNDPAKLTQIVREFPADAARWFEKSDLRDRVNARRLATALAAAGEHYPLAVVAAMERTRDPAALEQGLVAFKEKDYARAVALLERADNPLHIAARYYASASDWKLSTLEPTLRDLRPQYRELACRIYTWHANLLEFSDQLLEAHADYDRALAIAKNEPTITARILGGRSWNYIYIGNAEAAFRDAHRALTLLPHVVDTPARNTAYGAAAMAARQLEYSRIALDYQNAAVQGVRQSVAAASGDDLKYAKNELVAALRARAEIHVELQQNAEARGDLAEAAELAEATEGRDRNLFRMRILEVQAQTAPPGEAVTRFTEAIKLAKRENSTYRALLHFQRAVARGKNGDPRADDDIATAMNILRDEVRSALAANPTAVSRPLWEPYFSRFREEYRKLIESRIRTDAKGAFVYDELARAFEPMQILLQSRSAPPDYRPIETVADLERARSNLPEDTVILQYLVLQDKTYTWVVTRENVIAVSQRATSEQVKQWVTDALDNAGSGQGAYFTRAMRAAYGELFRKPLELAGASKTRIVIVPDEPMYGFPFNGLGGTEDEGFLIEHANIATAGSTSLYLYALARDRQLSNDRDPTVLLVGDPAFVSKEFRRLPYSRAEVEELERDYYRGAVMLTDTAATVENFLKQANSAAIIHFAGHGVPSPQAPWQSRLIFASGELTAERLLRDLSLERTRLVVLGACSSAGGGPVGPQGLAPLIRPLIGARVPVVVGTLWNVWDASAKELLVSFHCHYRHGDDVAVALRHAQLERLRKQEPGWQWAAFQVAGYAASPYPRPRLLTLEKQSSEHVCTQNSLHRPDGLHPQ
ncbi:MAG TPA: CHAT domain-containing protein [Thermoanaerobaculia bacterium]|nr:CHAT domain-containing protein [Thermoanaerobaculia bacterium]